MSAETKFGIAMVLALVSAPSHGQSSIFGEGPEVRTFAECVTDKLDSKGLAGTGAENLDQEVFEEAYVACDPDDTKKTVARMLQEQNPELGSDEAEAIALQQMRYLSALTVLMFLEPPRPVGQALTIELPPMPVARSQPVESSEVPQEDMRETNAPNH